MQRRGDRDRRCPLLRLQRRLAVVSADAVGLGEARRNSTATAAGTWRDVVDARRAGAGACRSLGGLQRDARRLAAANTNPRVPITEWSVIWEDGCIIVLIGATQGPLRVHELSLGNAG